MPPPPPAAAAPPPAWQTGADTTAGGGEEAAALRERRWTVASGAAVDQGQGRAVANGSAVDQGQPQAALRECRLTMARIGSVLDYMVQTAPVEALRTLGALRQRFAAAILAKLAIDSSRVRDEVGPPPAPLWGDRGAERGRGGGIAAPPHTRLHTL